MRANIYIYEYENFIPNLVSLGPTISKILLFSQTDEPTQHSYKDSACDADQEYILYGVCHAPFCLLHNFFFF